MPKPKEDERAAKIKSDAIEEALINCEHFIETYIKIESKGGETPVTPFKMWPIQKKTLRLMQIFRFFIFLKARQLGCTWLVLAYSLWRMLMPGVRVIALSKTEADAQALSQRVELMLRYMPDWFITQSANPLPGRFTYDNTLSWVKIRHPYGEDSIFMSLPAAQNSGASLTADIVIFDEWGLMEWAEQIYRAAFPTINRPGDKPENGQVFGISTMRIGSFFHRMVLKARAGLNSYKLIFWPWYSDPNRDQKWYQETQNNYEGNMKSDYPATIEEALSQAEGCFFQEINVDIHHRKTPDKIPDHYKRYCSIDYGQDGLAVIWYYVDNQGWFHAYRELYGKDKIISQAASLVLAANYGERVDGFFAPPDLWARRQETGKSFAELWAGYGIYLTKVSADREHGWELVRELIAPVSRLNEVTGDTYQTARLTIDKDACPNLWRCLTTIQRDPKNYNDVLDKTPDDHDLTHMPDALRYFASGRALPAEVGIKGKKREFWEEDEEEEQYIVW